MENIIQSFVDYLNNNQDHLIEKKQKSILKPIIIILISMAVIIVFSTPLISHGYVSLLLICIALTTLIIGIYKFYCIRYKDKYDYIYTPTGEVFKKKEVYINSADARKIHCCIASGNYSDLGTFKPEHTSSCFLNVLAAQQGNYYLFQVMEYIPYQYEPTSNVVKLEKNNANYMKSLINNK